MMSEAILAFPKQFTYQPEVVGELNPSQYTRFVVAGMGGSHLPADAMSRLCPDVDITVHMDYGLPHISEPKNTLVILFSYSGTTEEVLSAGEEGLKKGYSMAAIAIGGTLLDFARKYNLPYVQLSDTGIQPRSAWGFTVRALLQLLGREEELKKMEGLTALGTAALETEGKKLAEQLTDCVPVVYASNLNRSIAYNWKIKFNETGKIPAFYNVLPELNHNEMNGFDVVDATRALSQSFVFIFLRDEDDHPQIQKRFVVLKQLYEARGLKVLEVPLTGATPMEKMVRALPLADWTAVAIADHYGLESEQVPMVQEFKRLIA